MGDKLKSGEFEIRELQSQPELLQAIALEKQVWQLDDADSLPLTLAIALQAAGSLFLGGFAGELLAGFAFSFPARERGRWTMHSHMLGVREEFRNCDLGWRLKLAQREHALGMKLTEVSWTFDPLQSKNAHLNFAKLGVISTQYKVDFYGPSTSSALHQNRTDRLWVTWPVASQRVKLRLAGHDPRTEMFETLERLEPLVRCTAQGKAATGDLRSAVARQRIAIEIPNEIGALESNDPGLASAWRDATRWAFTEALSAGFFVKEFSRDVRGRQGPGVYLLEREPASEHVPELEW